MTEPLNGSKVVRLLVVREYGTVGVVRFNWNVTLFGMPASNEVLVTNDSGLIPPGENQTYVDVIVLADNVPEIDEVRALN